MVILYKLSKYFENRNKMDVSSIYFVVFGLCNQTTKNDKSTIDFVSYR